MKIAIFISTAKYPKELFTSVSGHVQIALSTANILKKNGHEVTLITNKAPAGYQIPPLLSKEIPVKTVGILSKKYPHQGAPFLDTLLLIKQLRKLIIFSNFDVIHFFGANRIIYLLGLLKMMNIHSRALITLHGFNASESILNKLITKRFLKKIDLLITLTNYTKEKLLQLIGNSEKNKIVVMPPGIDKQFTDNKLPPLNLGRYVLFWHDAHCDDGADICAEVFEQLSKEYSDVNFVFAVRRGNVYEKIFKISQTYKNIHLLDCPYKENVTIDNLLTLAAIVVLPFRKLSINPQLAVLETLLSGTPLITTPIESNKEIIEHRKTGILVQPSVNEVTAAIKELLNNPSLAKQIGINAQQQIPKKWNWEKYEEKLMDLYQKIKITKI